jgi:DNA polymerase I-like protein with 3'-5' exonuclease and polymerase domains
MIITLITEQPKKQENLDKLVGIFKKIKESNKELEIGLKVAKRTDSMRGYAIKDDEVLIVFGKNLYQHVVRDIGEFDKMAGNPARDVHKFSYFVRRDKKHYLVAYMPPIDFTMTKPETFLAFESFMKTLVHNTQNFKMSIRDTYLHKSVTDRSKWPIDVVENGFSPRVKLHTKYDEVKSYMYSLMDLPAWHTIAVDTETTGLQIWNKATHDVKIMSFATEDNLGHAVNMSLPGLAGCYNNGQTKEIKDLVEKYIFEKPKTFIAWNCGFDIFGLCNFFDRSYKDFLLSNRILDGMQLLHVFSENRKIEGYNLKAASRDLLCFPQYAFVAKYIHYLENYKTYTIEEILNAATNSLKYAAEDSAGEYSLTTRLKRDLDADPITHQHINLISPKVMAVKLEIEWNGIKIDREGMAKGSIACSGWELDNIIKPTLKKCEEATDNRCRAEMFVFSTTTGRLLYGKPYLNSMKIGSKASEYFVADYDHTFVYVDLDSADLRSAALVSQDKTLIEDLNYDTDFYVNFAHELFGNIEITDKERNISKLFVLAMLNLAGDTTIAKETGVSVNDVKEYKRKFYARYPGMQKYKGYLERYLKANNSIFSPTWRMRRFSEDDMIKDNYWKSLLSAHNFPFQATTADLMIVNCFDFIGKTREYGVKQCLLNVDAAIFNVPDQYLDKVKDEFKIFENVHADIIRGAKKFAELVYYGDEAANLPINIPRFAHKLYKGKNLKEMEKW